MPLSPSDIDKLVVIVKEAGRHILPYFQKPDAHGTRSKEDRSPVTEADMASHKYIVQALKREFPDIPVISEEDASRSAINASQPFFLVDPLDGTRAFMRGEDEFTVNIGLMQKQRPAFGVIGIPVRGLIYTGGKNIPARRQEQEQPRVNIRARPAPEDGLVVTRSRSHASVDEETFLHSVKVRDVLSASSAIKFCWLAEGSADLYPRFGRTMEWDTAAGHALLEAAGGCIVTPDGAQLLYNKPKFENGPFIACGGWRPPFITTAPRHPRNHAQG